MVFKKSSLGDIVSEDKGSKKKRFGKKSKIGVVFLLLLVALLAFGGAYYMYITNSKSSNSADLSQTNLNTDQVKLLLEEVGKKMELPTGETPTIATVTDVTKLQDQDFFRNAQNGDKVIIYSSTQKAILYRPSTGKIVDVAPVNLTANSDGSVAPAEDVASASDSAAQALSPTPAEKLRVVVLNSTLESGLATKASNLLDKNIVEVFRTSNAIGNYETTTITKVNKSKNITDAQLNDIISVYDEVSPKIATLPKDETAPSGADIVIILGEDFAEAY